jgi:hypothetical protein
MAYEGSLADSPFPQVLQRIGRSAETGILTLQGREEIIGVTFLDGEVVSVDAVNQAPEDGLGFILEDSGLVQRDEFTALVAENQAGGGRVIDLLVERGYISRQQLLDALRQQTLRLCAAACAWQEGQFRFYRGDQVSYERGIEPVGVDDLLARLAEPEAARASMAPPDEPLAPGAISRLEDMEEDFEPFEVLALPVAPRPPIEMPEPEVWDFSDSGGADSSTGSKARRSWLDFDVDWQAVTTPVMPGRLLGIGMLVSLAALVVLAPARFLVPLGDQARVRDAVEARTEEALVAKIDEAARTHFLLRGAFPQRLDDLVELGLLASRDTRLSGGRGLFYTVAPVSYQLKAAGEEGAIQTETIAGNFLLDPDFSPPEVVDTPPLVLLD